MGSADIVFRFILTSEHLGSARNPCTLRDPRPISKAWQAFKLHRLLNNAVLGCKLQNRTSFIYLILSNPTYLASPFLAFPFTSLFPLLRAVPVAVEHSTCTIPPYHTGIKDPSPRSEGNTFNRRKVCHLQYRYQLSS